MALWHLALATLLAIAAHPASASDAKSLLECERFSLAVQPEAVKELGAITLARKIRKCLELTLEAKVQSRLEVLKEALPLSVRSAVFLKDVCILNQLFNEYLYAPLSGFKYDTEQRHLFTWIGEGSNDKTWSHAKGDFKLVPAEKNYFFIVSTNHDEYLFVGGNNTIKDHRRKVFMWEPNWDEVNEKQGQWAVEPADKAGRVYIRNREYGEYLYTVIGMQYDAKRRTVKTWAKDDNDCHKNTQCIWTIKDC